MFEDSGKTWKSYFHDVAFNWVLLQDGSFTSPNIDSYELHFQSDLDGDNFPDYAFIEPAYAFFPNDEHPPHDVTAGEALIADVYNRICQSRYWESTLLIIPYDEHGGCYDHVTPPPAPPPDTIYSINPPFNFDRYGVRVPAVFISPYISRRTIVRAVPDWNFTLTDLPYEGLANAMALRLTSGWQARAVRELSADEERRLAWMGAASLVSWVTAIAAGRLIAYW